MLGMGSSSYVAPCLLAKWGPWAGRWAVSRARGCGRARAGCPATLRGRAGGRALGALRAGARWVPCGQARFEALRGGARWVPCDPARARGRARAGCPAGGRLLRPCGRARAGCPATLRGRAGGRALGALPPCAGVRAGARWVPCHPATVPALCPMSLRARAGRAACLATASASCSMVVGIQIWQLAVHGAAGGRALCMPSLGPCLLRKIGQFLIRCPVPVG
jgi:hypothetical protein